MSSYTDTPSLANRARAALLRIERIINMTDIPPEVRLVMVAERMAQEPILTDDSTAACLARRDAQPHTARLAAADAARYEAYRGLAERIGQPD